MLIILPPSETKAHGGTQGPLDLGSLMFPELNPTREGIGKLLAALDPEEALGVLKLSQKHRAEVEANTLLFSSPTLPAVERYTGVLYDALAAPTLPDSARERLAISSALFGVVSATDLIPHYRLSGTSRLAGATMKSHWGTALRNVLTQLRESGELIIDMRSGAYQNLGKVGGPGAITVRVECVLPDGSRKVVSHFNKSYKGQLARVLALTPQPAASIADVATCAEAAQMRVEVRGQELVLVV
ncbi:peroxide stress protein YaaA [Corynebacterium lizhenjunii]|uniref:Peroxide stress protein YaaA n=1 Tax=Corynebacterium lizhenjunii TaxID=2709394 RepID=A0A7T0PB58_9CORY|nr:peroxide stress protein YaaA [Corynebacterium lizhenjunii]QPK78402.1 peroxide stress protein YaaA [Corynebacterium lizhenjunii]